MSEMGDFQSKLVPRLEFWGKAAPASLASKGFFFFKLKLLKFVKSRTFSQNWIFKSIVLIQSVKSIESQ